MSNIIIQTFPDGSSYISKTKQTKEEFAIAELEKIKNKIAINDNSVWVFAGRKFIEKEEILNIIDGEVSKLKGENKE